MLGLIHQNLITAIDVILSKLPQEIMSNAAVSKLQSVLTQRKKNKKKDASLPASQQDISIKHANEIIAANLKSMTKIS